MNRVPWTNNPAEYGQAGREKFVVVAFDDSGKSGGSFSQVAGKWTNRDLNGDRPGRPVGEWMIRLKLNRDPVRRKSVRMVERRLADAKKAKQDFLWGFTDALHRVFPDRTYQGQLANRWTIDAARNEYASCQLVVIPAAVDIKMAEVFVGDFVSSSKGSAAKISRNRATVRVVRTARSRGVEWPDPLPKGYPTDVARGRNQAWWITLHVPPRAKPGMYQSASSFSADRKSSPINDRAGFDRHIAVQNVRQRRQAAHSTQANRGHD